jgi:hypothetical protein
MRRKLFQIISMLLLSAVFLRADYNSAPLDPGVTQQAPYKFAGIVFNIRDSFRGSGAVVANPRLVVSCAHLPFSSSSMSWSTDNLWYLAYESADALTRSNGKPLPALLHFANYADLATGGGNSASLEAFGVDFVVYYTYEDMAPGSAGFWYNGQAALVSPASKCIVGYPSGLYSSSTDARRNMMHQVGPFAEAFTQYWGNFDLLTGVSTGPGNSGGPVFVTNEAALTDADQGLRFAAVLVAGSETSLGDSYNEAGVVAATTSNWDMVNDALSGIGLAPINDSWSAALKIFGSSVTEVTNNQWATKEPGEPNHAGSAGGHSVWWRWVAPGNGPVAVSTVGSSIDTLLAIYTGSSLNALDAVAANDDSGGTTSAVNFDAVAGVEYWIAVDGKNGATGSVTFNLDFSPPAPVNDAFGNAIMISGYSVQTIGHNLNATKETGEPNHGGSAGGKSVWWGWTAPATGEVFLTTGGTWFDTLLGVYTGTNVAALTTIASNDDPSDTYQDASTLKFSATSGTTYWIAVDGFKPTNLSAGSGAISLSLNLTPTTPVIVMQPSSQAVNQGNPVALGAVARGAAPMYYQWQKNGTNIDGATASVFRISSVQASDAGSYTVVVSHGATNVTSDSATIAINLPPAFATQPLNQTVVAGTTATITTSIAGSPPPSDQWQLSTDGGSSWSNLADGGTNPAYSGATSTTLTITGTALAMSGDEYRCVATNSAGSATSNAITVDGHGDGLVPERGQGGAAVVQRHHQ